MQIFEVAAAAMKGLLVDAAKVGDIIDIKYLWKIYTINKNSRQVIKGLKDG